MSLFSLANVKRLLVIWAILAVVAVMTGASGNNSAPPTTGVHGSFMERVSFFGLFATWRWVLFLALGVIAWLIVSAYRPRAGQIRSGVDFVLATPRRLTTKRSTRLILMGVALIVVLLLPKFVHESFWMYLIVEQIGVWILLALGLNVVVGFAGLLDLGLCRVLRHRCLYDRLVHRGTADAGALSSSDSRRSGSYRSALRPR